MCKADSNSAVAPRCHSFGAFEHAKVKPVLLLLVKESIFESKCFLCQLLVLRTRSCAGEMGQGPADAGNAMCKAAHSFRRVGIGPVSLSVPMFSALVQKVSQLRSDTDVSRISCLTGQHQQWNDGACASGKQIVDVVDCSRGGDLVRQFTGALQTVAAVQSPMRQHDVGPDLRTKSEIRAGWKGPDLQPFVPQTFTLGLAQVQRMQRRRKQPVNFIDAIVTPSCCFVQISAEQQRESRDAVVDILL